MGLNLKAEQTEYEQPEVGEQLGVCYRIVDLGTREEQYKDNPPKKRTLVLYKDLVNWRGKPFSDEELGGFDVSKMIGAPANLFIEHNDDGKARIKNIFKPDVFKKTDTINDSLVFDLEVYCNEFNGNSSDETKAMCDVFDQLMEWQQNLIEESYEFQAANSSKPVQKEEVSDDPSDFDDEIPF